MTRAGATRWFVLAAALLSIGAYCVAAADLALAIIVLPGTTLAWALTEFRRQALPPRRFINALVLLVVAGGVLSMLEQGLSVELFSRFIAMLLAVKMLDRPNPRDTGQVLAISVYLAIGAVLTSNALIVAIMLLALLPVLVAAVLTYQLEAARLEAEAHTPATGSAARRDLRKLFNRAVFGGLTLSVVVFLVMPRGLGLEAFGSFTEVSLGQQTDFTDEVELGTAGIISQSSTPVLDLRVTTADGTRSRGSASSVFYLRGAVLDEYENGRWTSSLGDGSRSGSSAYGVDQPIHLWRSPELDFDSRATVTIRNAKPRNHLFTIWRSAYLTATRQVRLNGNLRDGTVVRFSEGGKFAYTVYFTDLTFREPPPIPDGARRAGVPTFANAVVASMAAQVLADAGVEPDPFARPMAEDWRVARVFEEHFRQDFRYTLEDKARPIGRDPIEWFLTDRREGHCEYFASAMTAMLRSVGVNARVVTGFVAAEYNEVTDHYTVRQSNAHAWVEAEVAPGHWRTFDPTPRADFRSLHEPSSSFIARVGRWIDAVEFAWITVVVGYDNRDRRRLLGDNLDDFGLSSWGSEIGARLEGRDAPRRVLRAMAIGLATFAASLVLGTIAVHFRTSIARVLQALLARVGLSLPRFRLRRPATATVPDAQLARAVLTAFDRLDQPKPHWRPMLEHARLVLATPAGRALDRGHADALLDAIRYLYHVRFGDAPLDRDRRNRLMGTIQQLRRAARSRTR